ncbi:MAG TPA: DUF1517 domain-containing protein [Kofleriaceae bacterium]|nr:DUF1517 domain-containing protein [Kofleriaceae bacterium]
MSFSLSGGRNLQGRSGSDSWPGILLLAGAGVVIAGIAVVTRPGLHARGIGAQPRRPLHVSRLRIAFAPGARTSLTRALRRLGNTADASRFEGRTALLNEVAVLLRRHAAAAAYAAADTEQIDDRRQARAILSRRAQDARVLFRDEHIRNYNGVVDCASSVDPHDPDHQLRRGTGFTVVTLLLATRDPPFQPVLDRAGLDAALAALTPGLLAELRAIEIIWMPADDHEPLSSVAVEARMPDLHRLDPAVAGAMICRYCATRYPREDLGCPRCGAHASAS